MKIALVGSAPSSMSRAPYKDESFKKFIGAKTLSYPPPPFLDDAWQIWGCSPGAYGYVERCTAWFELHRWEPGKPWFSPEYVQFMQDFKGPVYTGQVIPGLPGSIAYPIRQIINEFSPYFLTSSLSLMAALAIGMIEASRALDEKAGIPHGEDVIGFWGVDMAATEEYGYQRAGCQFFMVEAYRRGIKVMIPPESCLHRALPIYGISEWDPAQVKLLARKNELAQQAAYFTNQLAQMQNNAAFVQGAMEDLDYMTKTWTGSSDVSGEAQIATLVNDVGQVVDAPQRRDRKSLYDLHWDVANASVTEKPGPEPSFAQPMAAAGINVGGIEITEPQPSDSPVEAGAASPPTIASAGLLAGTINFGAFAEDAQLGELRPSTE